MSIVGPRPDLPYSVEKYKAWHHERLRALPGITGPWQVNGRCQVSFDDMVRADVEYVRDQSLSLDLKIMFLTIPLLCLREAPRERQAGQNQMTGTACARFGVMSIPSRLIGR